VWKQGNRAILIKQKAQDQRQHPYPFSSGHALTTFCRFGGTAESIEIESSAGMIGKRQRIWLIVLGITAALAAVALLWVYFNQPTTLVAVVDPSTGDAALLAAVGEQLNRERASIRLQVRQVADPDAVREALDKKQADLAVMRGDGNLPIEGRAVAIMRNNVLVLIARGGRRIQSVTDLAGKRIGLVGNDVDASQISAVLSHYNVPATWTMTPIEPARLASTLGSGGVDAIAVAGPLTGKPLADVVAAFSDRGPVFIPIDQADALAQRLRAYESSEIPAGMFGGNPAKPVESVKTIGFPYYLLAHSDASEAVITEFTRRLFSARRKLANEFPALAQMSAPSSAKDGTVPPHPGAAAYFNDAEKSFFDRYGDWVYILAMVASVLGSIAAAFSNFIGGAGLRRRGSPGALASCSNVRRRPRTSTHWPASRLRLTKYLHARWCWLRRVTSHRMRSLTSRCLSTRCGARWPSAEPP
jgi:TRAP transporter TAXI family solute receptor